MNRMFTNNNKAIKSKRKISSTKILFYCHLELNYNDVNNNDRRSKKDFLQVEEKQNNYIIKIHRLCENYNIGFQLLERISKE